VVPPKTDDEQMWDNLLRVVDEGIFSSQHIQSLEWQGASLNQANYKDYFMFCILKEYEQKRDNRLRYESLCDVPFRLPPSKSNPSSLYFSIHKQSPDLVLEVLVPGLSEGRPRLYRNNLVRIQLIENGSYHEWVGRVISTSRANTALVGGISKSILNYYPGPTTTKQKRSEAQLSSQALNRFHISFPLDHRDERIMLHVLHTMSDQFTKKLFSKCQYNKNLPLQVPDPPQNRDTALHSKRPNTEQRLFCHAVHNPCSSDLHARPSSMILLHGPPGTGKTTSICAAVRGIKRDSGLHLPVPKILLCAPSDSAADYLAQVLMNDFTPEQMYRLYSTDREVSFIPQALRQYTTITSDMTHGFPVQRVGLLKGGAVELQKYEVVICTCKDAIYFSLLRLPFNHFTHLFIDEAAQAVEPEILIPMMFCATQNISIIGDPRQLGSNVVSEQAKQMKYDRSLLERMMALPDQDYIILTKNYRHDARIIRIAWKLFYEHINGRVNAIEYMKKGREIDWSKHPATKHGSSFVKEYPVQFFGDKYVDVEKDGSWFCSEEAAKIVCIVRDLRENRQFVSDDIGVIAPYRSQVFEIRRQLRAAGFSDINVGTVLDYQGNEKRIIIISNTRAASVYNPHLTDEESLSNEDIVGKRNKRSEYADTGFANNAKGFNVAITRARGLVILVGDPRAMIQEDNVWQKEFLFVCLNAASFMGEVPSGLEQMHKGDTEKISNHRKMERAFASFGVFAENENFESGALYEHIIQNY